MYLQFANVIGDCGVEEGGGGEAAEMVFVNEALQLAPEMKRPQSAS